MGTLPERSVPSMASYIQGIKIKDKSEKALMVRVGVLMDSIVNAQRGLSNAGAKLNRRSQAINGKRPPKIVGSTENVFNGASVIIDPIGSASSLSNYEIQIDSDPNFSDPTTKVVFNKNVVFKGLLPGTTYNIRVRALTKSGQSGPWSLFDPVVTTVSDGLTSADFTGSIYGETPEIHIFTFNYFSEAISASTNGGRTVLLANPWVATTTGGAEWTSVRITALSAVLQRMSFTSPLLTVDTSNVAWTDEIGEMIRYWPLVFFDIFDLNVYVNNSLFLLNFPFPTTPYTEVFSVTGGTTAPTVIIKF
jgi:hypothetical protein